MENSNKLFTKVQKDQIEKIQLYVGNYKIYTKNSFYYISNDGVSRHKSEEAFKKASSQGEMEFYFRYRGIFKELYDMLTVGILPKELEDKYAVSLVNIREMIKNFKIK